MLFGTVSQIVVDLLLAGLVRSLSTICRTPCLTAHNGPLLEVCLSAKRPHVYAERKRPLYLVGYTIVLCRVLAHLNLRTEAGHWCSWSIIRTWSARARTCRFHTPKTILAFVISFRALGNPIVYARG